MFSKVFAAAVIALTFSVQAHAHAAIAPVLGVAGTPKRSDVQRPSANAACGRTKIAATIDTSTPVVAAADGTFTVTATNFNGGRDGSRQVTMTVDATGTGSKFVAGTVSKNGQAAPASTGSEQITASLPAGTKCTGGKAGNLCLASFKTLGGFGNCVVIQQGAAAAANGTAAGAAAAGDAAAAGAAAGAGATGGAAAINGTEVGTAAASNATIAAGHTGKGHTGEHRKERPAQAAASLNNAGTRAPRALLSDIEARGADAVVAKRGIISWLWA